MPARIVENEHCDIAREGFVEKFDSFLFDWPAIFPAFQQPSSLITLRYWILSRVPPNPVYPYASSSSLPETVGTADDGRARTSRAKAGRFGDVVRTIENEPVSKTRWSTKPSLRSTKEFCPLQYPSPPPLKNQKCSCDSNRCKIEDIQRLISQEPQASVEYQDHTIWGSQDPLLLITREVEFFSTWIGLVLRDRFLPQTSSS